MELQQIEVVASKDLTVNNTGHRCDKCLAAGQMVFDFKNFLPDPIPPGSSVEDELDGLWCEEEIYFGTYAAMRERATYCRTCDVLTEQIAARMPATPDDAECSMDFHSNFVTVEFSVGETGFSLLPTQLASHGYSPSTNTFAKLPAAREEADVAIIREWKICCTETHGAVCNENTINIPQRARPKYVIDLEEMRVVHCPQDGHWVALSYVWGRVSVTKAVKSNIPTLMQVGALQSVDFAIPATISDAMRLAAALGEKYLWTDSLCIVQDDEEIKRSELRKMDGIYRHAVFTIAAAEGDNAHHGITGVPGGSRPHLPTYDYLELLPGKPLFIVPRCFADWAGSAWDERAWTFQEGLLSTRVVVCRGSMKWNCRKIAAVDIVSTPGAYSPAFAFNDDDWSTHASLLFMPTWSLTKWPDIWAYFLLMMQYTTRHLTFESDAVDAVLGLTNILHPYFQGGFHFGLPEMVFDIALLWQPAEPLLRRRSTPPDTDRDPPSWSFLGWRGRVDFSMCNHVTDWEGHEWAQKIFLEPFGSGYEYDTRPRGSKRRYIDNSYYDYRRAFIANTKGGTSGSSEPVLPAGWQQLDEVKPGWARYEHPLLTKEVGRTRSFPLPLTNGEVEPDPLLRSPVLLFETEACVMKFDHQVETSDKTFALSRMRHTTIRTSSGQWAGLMRHNVAAAEWPCGDEEEYTLVAISIASINNEFRLNNVYEMDCPERQQPVEGESYEFLNVLWVGTDTDGFMYRKGLGRVAVEVWDVDPTRAPISVRLK